MARGAGGGQPLVSVVVPTYNAAELVPQTVASVLSQDYPRLEVVVVDDGSTDHTRLALEPLLADERVSYVWKPNGGVASARNLGLDRSRGELVAFCDSDDLWLPAKLSRQVPLFGEDGVLLAYCGALLVDGQGRLLRPKAQAYHQGRCHRELLVHNFITNSTAVVRREAVERVGRFDERRELQGVEDKHLWARLARAGLVRAAAEPLACYRITGSGVSSRQERMLRAELLCLADLQRRWAGGESPGLFRRARGAAYAHYGVNLFHRGDYRRARRYLGRGLALGGARPGDLARWLLTLLPRPWLQRLRRTAGQRRRDAGKHR